MPEELFDNARIKAGDIVQYRPVKSQEAIHPASWKVGRVKKVYLYGDEWACEIDFSSYKGELPEPYLDFTCYASNVIVVCRPTNNRSDNSQA